MGNTESRYRLIFSDLNTYDAEDQADILEAFDKGFIGKAVDGNGKEYYYVFLTVEEYNRQLKKADVRWLCPHTEVLCWFDDVWAETYEKS